MAYSDSAVLAGLNKTIKAEENSHVQPKSTNTIKPKHQPGKPACPHGKACMCAVCSADARTFSCLRKLACLEMKFGRLFLKTAAELWAIADAS